MYYNLVRIETILKASENNNLESSLQIGFETASNLMNKFWVLEKSLSDDIERFYEKKFKNNFIIGLQLRYEYLDAEKDTEKFIECALTIENSFLAQKENKNKTVKWFISSDKKWAFNKLKSKLGDKLLESEKGVIGHVQVNSDSYYRTLLDNELLARSNEIIITGGSTFGFVASIRKAQLPFYINGKSKDQGACSRMSLSKPSQRPQGYAVI